MLFNSLLTNINHFVHHSSLIQKKIYSCNESLIQMIVTIIYLHSLKVLSKQMNNLIILCMMKNAILNIFDLAQGLVFRCHIVYYKQISSNDLLSDKDVIIFNFHHALFDFPSMDIFLHDLNQAYTTGQLSSMMTILLYVILIVNINISYFSYHITFLSLLFRCYY